MRKFLSIFLSTIMVLTIGSFFTACGKVVPKLNLDIVEEQWEKYAEKESENGDMSYVDYYTVRYDGKDGNVAEYPFFEDGVILKCLHYDLSPGADSFGFDVVCEVLKCDSAKTAKKVYEYYMLDMIGKKEQLEYIKYLLKKYKKDMTSEEEKELCETRDYLEENLSNYIIGHKGKYVWRGEKELIEYTKD